MTNEQAWFLYTQGEMSLPPQNRYVGIALLLIQKVKELPAHVLKNCGFSKARVIIGGFQESEMACS